jgi:Uma2 family endonuclease
MEAVQLAEMVTLEAFEAFLAQPESRNRDFEWIGGRIVEVVSNSYSSEIAALLLIRVGGHVLANKLGRVTGADGGYIIGGDRYIPDVAFVSYTRQPEPCHDAYNPVPPDLAVEVLSPTNAERDIRLKIVNYLRVGTTAWLVDPAEQTVEVYAPDQAPQIIRKNGVLDGGKLLPGFKLALADLFAEGTGAG